uniref:Secreted protein n=1 Tax=Steinernema glaseri TaxID=37863 RepID=A0A1I7YYM5_9BILA
MRDRCKSARRCLCRCAMIQRVRFHFYLLGCAILGNIFTRCAFAARNITKRRKARCSFNHEMSLIRAADIGPSEGRRNVAANKTRVLLITMLNMRLILQCI